MNSEHAMYGTPHIPSERVPMVIQILSVIGFGVFSIVAVSLAFSETWVAGVAVVGALGWVWSGSRTFGGNNGIDQGTAHMMAQLKPGVREEKATSGNASFDAYKAETLARLEEESREFDDFLARLREARDASEFDQFMTDRARANQRELNETQD